MAIGDETNFSGRQRPHPILITRTMRGGPAYPEDLPAPDPEMDVGPMRVRRDVDPDGTEMVQVWMSADVAEGLAAKNQAAAKRYFAEGDAAAARKALQFADDLRALVAFSELTVGLQPPAPGTELAN